jgi:hypothetical protein
MAINPEVICPPCLERTCDGETQADAARHGYVCTSCYRFWSMSDIRDKAPKVAKMLEEARARSMDHWRASRRYEKLQRALGLGTMASQLAGVAAWVPDE